jgi:hypothetical protein
MGQEAQDCSTDQPHPAVIRGPRKGQETVVDVMWTATDPGSRRLSTERRTSADDYIARIEALLAVGEGYSEVHRADQQYPLLALSFKDGYGVIHQFSAEDKVLLLVGDGVIDAHETALVPVLDDIDDASFSGDYVLSAEHAWTAVKDFLRHGAVEDLGEWQEL